MRNRAPGVWLCWLLVWLLFQTGGGVSGARDTGRGKPIEEGQTFPSPDGKLLATFLGGGFDIKNVATGEVSTVRSLPPVTIVSWTRDSKTMVTVEHLAGGSSAVLFHWQDGAWQRVEADPPGGPFDRYQVTRCEAGESSVKLSCQTLTRHDGAATAQVVSFDFDPGTGKASNVVTTTRDKK